MSIPVNWKSVSTMVVAALIIGGFGDFMDLMGVRAEVTKIAKNDIKQDRELEQLKIQTKIITYNFCEEIKNDHPMKKQCRKILTGVDK